MFTQPVSAPPLASSHQTASAPSTRPSRLRGLSYLRNYTHTHLLSRDNSYQGSSSNSSNNNNHSNSLSNLAGTVTQSRSGSTSPRRNRNHTLTRSTSFTPHTVTDTSTSHRMSLAANSTEPASIPAARLGQRSATTGNMAALAAASASDAVEPSPAANAASTESRPARGRSNTTSGATSNGTASEPAPSIRFSAYFDPRSTRPSLTFSPLTRSYPAGSTAIRVGRYSERDTQSAATFGNTPTAAPVGFKSKVVSRKHCEFWHEDGRWFVKDVKSSSGTFLNHIRLSSPSQESKPYPINDGDIIQLGIDFKGGEEMIFRCVKMRVELNRGWQNKLNTFNMATHKRLRTMATNGPAPSNASINSQDCSICLNSIAPCQSLFVAPCSHTWHFKCVRSLLTSPQYPIFICPNCRAGADLEADVEEPEPGDDWEEMEDAPEPVDEDEKAQAPQEQTSSDEALDEGLLQDNDVMDITMAVNALESSPPQTTGSLAHSATATEPLPIVSSLSGSGRARVTGNQRTPSPPSGAEGPITPRNDAGPWVFDGSAGRPGDQGRPGMSNLAAAVDTDVTMNGQTPGESTSR